MGNNKSIYEHAVDLKKLHIPNEPREEFRKKLEDIPYRGYEVEQLKDGRKIVITKPGGKKTYGKMKREDFMVWIYDEKDNSLWLISHDDIKDDLVEKLKKNKEETIKIINALKEVCEGKDPSDVLNNVVLSNPIGEEPETLLKAYKWIWGQEDCNYPNGEGRWMSMKGLLKLIEEG